MYRDPLAGTRGDLVLTKYHLLFVEDSRFPSYGGSKRFIVNLTTAMDRTRWEPHVLFFRNGPWVADLEARQVWTRVHERTPPVEPGRSAGRPIPTSMVRFGVRRTGAGEVRRAWFRQAVRDARSLLDFSFRRRAAVGAIRASLPDRVDLIHYNGPLHAALEWFYLARELGVPLMTRENGVWERPPAAYALVAPQLGGVVCLTAERVEELRRFGRGRITTFLIPNGIAPERLRPHRSRSEVRTELGIPEACTLIVTAGHLQPWKGQQLGVEAALRLFPERPDFCWIFCGYWLDSAYVRSLEERIREAGATDRVRILPERADLADLFAAADIAVHTSIRPDPFPNVALEAMGSGLPMVAPREGALAEVVRDAVDGLHYVPRDSASLYEAVLTLILDPERRARLGGSAQSRVLADYSLEAMVAGHCRAYESVLGGRRAAEGSL